MAVSGIPVADYIEQFELGNWFVNKKYFTYHHLEFDYSKERQTMENVGPIPEGSYWISTCETNSGENAQRHKFGLS